MFNPSESIIIPDRVFWISVTDRCFPSCLIAKLQNWLFWLSTIRKQGHFELRILTVWNETSFLEVILSRRFVDSFYCLRDLVEHP